MKNWFLICLIFIPTLSFSQIKVDYFYRPARMELETDLSYSYENWTIGFRYNKEINYFLLNNNYIIHGYIQFPFTNHLKLEIVYGTKNDYEISLLFNYPKLNFEIGYSKSGLLIEFDIWNGTKLQKDTNF